MAASEVDLPEPVQRPSQDSPRLVMTISLGISGNARAVKSGNFRRYGPDHHADVLLLNENVDSKPRDSRNGDREIALSSLAKIPRAGAGFIEESASCRVNSPDSFCEVIGRMVP